MSLLGTIAVSSPRVQGLETKSFGVAETVPLAQWATSGSSLCLSAPQFNYLYSKRGEGGSLGIRRPGSYIWLWHWSCGLGQLASPFQPSVGSTYPAPTFGKHLLVYQWEVKLFDIFFSCEYKLVFNQFAGPLYPKNLYHQQPFPPFPALLLSVKDWGMK